jgi:hypothetical protein
LCGCRPRRQVFAWQRFERQHHRGLAGLRRQRTGARDQRPVAEVDAIETADGDRRAPMSGLEALDSTNEFHGDYAPLLRM